MNLHHDKSRRSSSRRVLWSFVALASVGLILTGCPGGADLEDAEQHLNTGPCDALPIFVDGCSGSICHGTGDGAPPSGGVDLIAPGVAARLLDVDAAYPDLSGCPDVPEKLINSTNLDASLLWTKLNNTQVCGDGMPIPHSATALGDQDMACVRSWMQSVIDNGAGAPAPGTGGADGTGGDGAGTGGADGTGGMATGGAVGTGGAGTGGADGTGGMATGGMVGTGGAAADVPAGLDWVDLNTETEEAQ